MHMVTVGLLKGIFTDSNNIFLRHKSQDVIKKKRLFPKFQLILIFVLQVMNDKAMCTGTAP